MLCCLYHSIVDRQVGGANVWPGVRSLVLGRRGTCIPIRVAGFRPPFAATLSHTHLICWISLTLSVLGPCFVSVLWLLGRGSLLAGLLPPWLWVGPAFLMWASQVVSVWCWLLLWRSYPSHIQKKGTCFFWFSEQLCQIISQEPSAALVLMCSERRLGTSLLEAMCFLMQITTLKLTLKCLPTQHNARYHSLDKDYQGIALCLHTHSSNLHKILFLSRLP